jgi:hypothetical protein
VFSETKDDRDNPDARLAAMAPVGGRARDISTGPLPGVRGSLGGQVPLHLVERPPAQIMRLEQMAEPTHRRLVRHRLAAEVDANKMPHRPRIVERLFHCRVGQD